MKSFFLKLAAHVVGAPVIATGQGLQATGRGLNAAGDACIRGGVVTEITGHAVKGDLMSKADLAAEAVNQRELVAMQRRIERRIEKIDAITAHGNRKDLELMEERDLLSEQLKQLAERIVDAPIERNNDAIIASIPDYAHA